MVNVANPQLSHPFKCQECGKRLQTYRSLQNHMKTHAPREVVLTRRGNGVTRSKPTFAVTCDICGRGFTSKSILQTHKKFHFNPVRSASAFSCEICGKDSKSATGLQAHNKRHVDVASKMFKMKENDSFAGSDEDDSEDPWADDERTDDDENAAGKGSTIFECEECGITAKELVKIHRATHDKKTAKATESKTTPFECLDCGRSFSAAKPLKIHRSTRHKSPSKTVEIKTAPKKPQSSYSLWLEEKRSSLAKPGMSSADVSKAAGVEWKKLKNKKKWEKEAIEDKNRYEREMKAFKE